MFGCAIFFIIYFCIFNFLTFFKTMDIKKKKIDIMSEMMFGGLLFKKKK